jgi:DNA-binding NarL/FixJ family response regulator
VRVLLADDQPALRSAVRFLLEQEPDLSIVGEAADVAGLMERVSALHPDLLLLDWELPGLNAVHSARHVINSLYAECPGLHIIVLSGRPEAGLHALASGADAFVSKADPPERLLAALRRVKLKSR